MKKTVKIPKTVTETFDDSGPLTSLRDKLALADPEIQHYVAALEAENLKSQTVIAKLQAENMTLNNRVKVFLKNKEDRESFTKIDINLDKYRTKELK